MLGAGACPAMLALNLLPAAPTHAFDLQGGSNKGKHIIILGGGLAGLTSAYELRKLGYRCTILEAWQRSGGRCWSVRGGATTTETQNAQHTAIFDKELYFNAGPSRIPHHHQLPKMIKTLSQYAVGPMSISAPAIRAVVSYQDQDFMQDALTKTLASKQFLDDTLKREGYEYIPPSTNFVMFPLKMDGKHFVDEMSKRGVSIRNWEFNKQHWCRVSIGRVDEMQGFADAFTQVSWAAGRRLFTHFYS